LIKEGKIYKFAFKEKEASPVLPKEASEISKPTGDNPEGLFD